jgi:hypothetical protein
MKYNSPGKCTMDDSTLVKIDENHHVHNNMDNHEKMSDNEHK